MARRAYLASANGCLAVTRKPHPPNGSRCSGSREVSPARPEGADPGMGTRDMTNLQIKRVGWPGNLAALAVRDPPAVQVREQT